ncbi:MAG: OmpA family protein [Sandaracinaceae bacterium]|nr:OmpA family protein [Sandaracinaceae bacterium]
MKSTLGHLRLIAIAMSLATACGGGETADTTGGSGSSGGGTSGGSSGADDGDGSGDSGGSGGSGDGQTFQLSDSTTAGDAHGDSPSRIRSSATGAAMRLFIVDPENGPLPGIVIKLTAPDGTAYYTSESDSVGYAEVLVPPGARYRIEYLTLGGRAATTANVEVPPGPNQDIRLTMRYRRRRPPPIPPLPDAPPPPEDPGFVMEGILFETGRATIQPESFPRIDGLVEYMTYVESAHIRISGHTDNVGNPARNQTLSEQRAQAVRAYVIAHGIDASRIEAVGYGDTRPVATNDTEAGRAQNRRIEATQLE